MSKKLKGPKILFLDIETAPILAHVWSIWDQNVGLNQIKKDWHVLSWAAKWEHEKKMMYEDQSNVKPIENDKGILKKLWKLLDETDIVVTQNGIKFDHRKINARFVIHGMKPPSPYKMVDTCKIAKKKFAFTSNKLEYLSANINKKYKKLTDKNRKFVGFELWKACLEGNKKAWAEMKKYNKLDVYALEELFNVLNPWDNTITRSKYLDEDEISCNSCGGTHLNKKGYFYTSRGKYQRYRCMDCGFNMRDNKNLLSKEKRKSMLYNAKDQQ